MPIFKHTPPGATETVQLSNTSTLEYIKITRVRPGKQPDRTTYFKGFLKDLDVNTKVKLSDIDPGYDSMGAAKVRQGNSTSVKISFSVVAADGVEARSNFNKIRFLFKLIRPERNKDGVPLDTPTFKVSYMNVFKNFYGYIEEFSFTPDLEQGAFIPKPGVMYPKVYTMNLNIEQADQGDRKRAFDVLKSPIAQKDILTIYGNKDNQSSESPTTKPGVEARGADSPAVKASAAGVDQALLDKIRKGLPNRRGVLSEEEKRKRAEFGKDLEERLEDFEWGK